jgi:hypothetical protein
LFGMVVTGKVGVCTIVMLLVVPDGRPVVRLVRVCWV